MVPSSLFAHMMDTKMVSSRRASFTIWAVMMPSESWFQERHIKAFTFQAAARVDDGFVLVDRGDDVPSMFEPAGALAYIRAAPLMAMLFDSVAPEVKMISFGWAPRRSATCDRAVSTPFSASQPYAWFRLLELP